MSEAPRTSIRLIEVDGIAVTFKIMSGGGLQPTVFGWSADTTLTGAALRKALIKLGDDLRAEEAAHPDDETSTNEA